MLRFTLGFLRYVASSVICRNDGLVCETSIVRPVAATTAVRLSPKIHLLGPIWDTSVVSTVSSWQNEGDTEGTGQHCDLIAPLMGRSYRELIVSTKQKGD